MKRQILFPPLLALAAPLLVGCASQSGMMFNAFFAGVAVARVADPPPADVPVDAQVEEPDPEPRIERVPTGTQVPVDLQPRPATKPAPRPFDLGGAYAAMAKVDLTTCKEAGVAPGYGHVELEVLPDGTVGGVMVQLHAATAGGRACAEQAFRGVRVAPFDGEQPVRVQRDFFVR
jgi:hypothetical protein